MSMQCMKEIIIVPTYYRLIFFSFLYRGILKLRNTNDQSCQKYYLKILTKAMIAMLRILTNLKYMSLKILMLRIFNLEILIIRTLQYHNPKPDKYLLASRRSQTVGRRSAQRMRDIHIHND